MKQLYTCLFRHILIACILIVPYQISAQKKLTTSKFKIPSAFMENKGQVFDQNGNPRQDVKYILNNANLKLILKENSFSYEFSERKTTPISENNSQKHSRDLKSEFSGEISIARIDVLLKGANPNPKILAEHANDMYVNNFTEKVGKEGISHVRFFDKVTYRNIYNNIDIEFIAQKDGSIKYNLIVKPGGNLNDIRLSYEGMENLQLKGNILYGTTSVNNFQENIPYSYLKESGKSLNITYHKQDNEISFKGSYNVEETLIIDPIMRIWGTYYGTNLYLDAGYEVTTDTQGNVYMSGLTSSTYNIATSGTYKSKLNDVNSPFLTKFDTSGDLIWGTYLGTYNYIPVGVIADDSGNVFICISDILGTQHAFLAKFNSSGNLVWGSYTQGNNTEFGRSIAMDKSGNTYMAGSTNSQQNISTSNGYQTSFGGGDYDGFLRKYSPSGNVIWSTYFGGQQEDFCKGVATDYLGNVFITGYTSSSSGIATSGKYMAEDDAFIAKFDSSGSLSWSYYLGGAGHDEGNHIATDSKGNIFITGITASSSGFATANAYQSAFANIFLIKLNTKGQLVWGTYFGGSGYNDICGMTMDDKDNVLITGFTTSQSYIASPNGYQNTFGGGKYWGDAFFAKFNNAGNLFWSSYYGGRMDDFSEGIAVDHKNNIYITGSTTSSNNIASSNGYITSYLGDNDAFLVKFEDPLKADFENTNTCVGQSMTLTDISQTNDSIISYYWKLPNDSIVKTKQFNYTFSDVGKYSITHAVITNTGLSDTIIRNVIIYDLPKVSFQADPVCLGTASSFVNTSKGSNSVFYWDFGDSSTANTFHATYTYAKAGKYLVKLKITNINGCTDSLTKTVIVNEMPKANFTFTSPCKGAIALFTNTSSPIDSTVSFSWDFGDFSQISTDINPTHTFNYGKLYKVKLKITNNAGCVDSIEKEVNVLTSNKPYFTVESFCAGKQTLFKNQYSEKDFKSIEWDFGDSITNSTEIMPIHIYAKAGKYNVKFKLTNIAGCSDSSIQTIEILETPKADFSASPVCEGQSMDFINNSGFTNPVFYEWDFGDSTTFSTSKNTSHLFSKAGKYSVKLKLTNLYGCSDSIRKTVEVLSQPKADFEADSVCEGSPTVFINKSEVIGTPSYEWDFGDSSEISTTQNPKHTYKKAGHYTVIYKISNGSCMQVKKQDVIVNENPKITFTYIKDSNEYIFIPSDVSLVSYKWDFGDGETSEEVSPTHLFSKKITIVKLLVTNEHGCEAEVLLDINTNMNALSAPLNYVKIYPNPVTHHAKIEYTLNKSCITKVVLIDLTGKTKAILKEPTMEQIGKHSVIVDASELSNGIYFLQIIAGEKVYNHKFEKLN